MKGNVSQLFVFPFSSLYFRICFIHVVHPYLMVGRSQLHSIHLILVHMRIRLRSRSLAVGIGRMRPALVLDANLGRPRDAPATTATATATAVAVLRLVRAAGQDAAVARAVGVLGDGPAGGDGAPAVELAVRGAACLEVASCAGGRAGAIADGADEAAEDGDGGGDDGDVWFGLGPDPVDGLVVEVWETLTYCRSLNGPDMLRFMAYSLGSGRP